jgi:hypothetical protein
MQIDLGPQCDALVESGTFIELNISLRVFGYRAHGEMRAAMIRPLSTRPGTPVRPWRVGVVASSVRLAYGVHAARGTVRSTGGSRLHQKKVRTICP